MDKEIKDRSCEQCLHYRACLMNSEYVPSICSVFEDKEDYRKQSGWITVAERMPDPNEYDWVLVAAIFNEDGTYGVPMVAEFRRGKWYSLGDNDFTVEDRFMTVTHWMPLPESPKMKGESDA